MATWLTKTEPTVDELKCMVEDLQVEKDNLCATVATLEEKLENSGEGYRREIKRFLDRAQMGNSPSVTDAAVLVVPAGVLFDLQDAAEGRLALE